MSGHKNKFPIKRYKRILPVVIGVLGSVTVVGCTSAPDRGGFNEVQETVKQRTDQSVVWPSAEQGATGKRVDKLLEKPLKASTVAQVALLNNATFYAQVERLGIARADLVEAGLLENPVFEASAAWPLEGGEAAALEFGLVQNFLQALEIPLRRSVAKSRLEAVKSDVAKQALDLVHRARDAFYDLQTAKQQAELLRNVVDARGASTATIQRIREAGNVPQLRVAREEQDFERAKIRLAQARGRVAQARERLNRIMGLWGERAGNWETGARLPELPDNPFPDDFQPDKIVDRNLDLMMARQRVATATARAGIARVAPFLPEMHAGGEAERSGEKEWEAGPVAEVTLPIFDTGQTARDRSDIRVRQRKYSAEATAVALRSQVRATRERVERFHKIASRYKSRLLPLSAEILRRTRQQYNAMGAGVFDLIAARTDQVNTARRYIAALAGYWQARNDLQTLTAGKLTGGDGTATTQIAGADSGGDEEGGH